CWKGPSRSRAARASASSRRPTTCASSSSSAARAPSRAAAAERAVMELEGQTAIVTGAGRNIGRAIALELAGMGADIVVAEVDRATGERTAEEVRGRGRRALALPTDVTRLPDLQAMADRAMAEWGRIDILVNNAGIHRSAHTAQVTEDDWDRLLAVNAKGVFFASQAVLRHMVP